MMTRLGIRLGATAILLILAGWTILSSGRLPEPSRQPDISSTIWQLKDVLIDNETRLYPVEQGLRDAAPQQLQIVDGQHPQIKGYDGCNSFHGLLDYSAAEGRFHLGPLNVTVQACSVQLTKSDVVQTLEPNRVTAELSFIQALSRSERYEFSDDTLTLYSKDARQVLVLVRAIERFHYHELRLPVP
jgi:heat shock protein HslJ